MTFTTTPRRLAKTLAIAAGLSVVSLSAFAAGDAALYGPTAPKGSSFVRIYNASNQEDSSWDGVWQSAGRITAEGYDVEMRIPFSTLRFPTGGGLAHRIAETGQRPCYEVPDIGIVFH